MSVLQCSIDFNELNDDDDDDDIVNTLEAAKYAGRKAQSG